MTLEKEILDYVIKHRALIGWQVKDVILAINLTQSKIISIIDKRIKEFEKIDKDIIKNSKYGFLHNYEHCKTCCLIEELESLKKEIELFQKIAEEQRNKKDDSFEDIIWRLLKNVR